MPSEKDGLPLKAGLETASILSRSESPPPPYSPNDSYDTTGPTGSTNGPRNPVAAATVSFSDLDLSSGQQANAGSCLAHLKLLYAFETMKEDIGYTDGLWGLWNSRATDDGAVHIHAYDEKGHLTKDIKSTSSDNEARQTALGQIREKRWALFVARAVDRYETWWNSMVSEDGRLHKDDMEQKGSDKYEYFVLNGYTLPEMTTEQLPPLDVLMVWHAHMLNPRAYLQDCLRAGLRGLWWQGIPWGIINKFINQNFGYDVPDEVKAIWVAKTNRPWNNTDDSLTKSMPCPVCEARLNIPWTSCGAEEHDKKAKTTSLVGEGYGDGDLKFSCYECACVIDKGLLSVARFRSDYRDLTLRDVPMPGTVLRPATGRPDIWEVKQRWGTKSTIPNPLTLPNRLLKYIPVSKIEQLLRPSAGEPQKPPTMEDVRTMIDGVIQDKKALSLNGTGKSSSDQGDSVHPISRSALRNMMNKYWHNFSSFTLDLSGAVMRQGIFVAKMYKLDWFHSAAAPELMSRLCVKYKRFMSMMRFNQEAMFVPTLDVDLAWHTHQLSPAYYYKACTSGNRIFIDHDDKVEEHKLGEAFEFTSKTYQETYNDVYSECTCWYCEAVRASLVSSVGRVFKMSYNEKLADKFYTSGQANLCPPGRSAHISAHNSVSLHEPDDINNSKGLLTLNAQKQAQAAYQQRIDEAYRKACQRAEKKGRKLPPKEDYYEHWGSSYYMYGPWYPASFTPTLYYAPPNSMPSNHIGAHGGCVAGDCASDSVADFTPGTRTSGLGDPRGAYSRGFTVSGGCGSAGGGGGCGGGG